MANSLEIKRITGALSSGLQVRKSGEREREREREKERERERERINYASFQNSSIL